jgi:general secretion pathway protein E/type IV pilus assembly protein PilB
MQREVGIIAADTRRTVPPDPLINNSLLLPGTQRATDVHRRPMAHGIAVAYRVDGVMVNVAFLPPQLSRLATAIKLQAGMDIAEQRLPQDGRWTANLLERRYDIRVSSIVTPFGENIVMRLLSQERASFSFPALGFLQEDVAILARIFDEPFGILLLTGPTGSGKSTTLVAGLTSLDLLGKNVLTVENPIEYVVPLARQTQVNETAGYDFSNAMRHFLRHDPDVILIGEMRDQETASTALTRSHHRPPGALPPCTPTRPSAPCRACRAWAWTRRCSPRASSAWSASVWCAPSARTARWPTAQTTPRRNTSASTWTRSTRVKAARPATTPGTSAGR